MTERLDLPRRYRDQIEALLREHVPGVEVWAYGSRVCGRSHEGSDLDLVLRGPDLKRVDSGQLGDLIEALEESNVPIIVQTHDWTRLPERFHREIEREYVVLVERGEEGTTKSRGEWLETSLGEVIELKRGYDLPRYKRVSGSVPLVSSSGVSDYHVEAKVKGPGVVTGRYGTLGQVFFVPDDFWPLNTTLYVRQFKGNDPRFISYFLRGLDFLAYSDKAAVPGLNRNHLHQATVRYPSDVSEQRAIAHILGTLDDKIEINRRMNETLEEMARALFKSWFVDFDPVRAKMEGRDTGLPPEVAARFPDRLVDSELGEIPEGWQVGCLADIAVAPRRGVDPTSLHDETPYIGLEHMPRRSLALTQWEGAGKVTSSKSVFKKGEFLFGKLRPYFHKVGVAPASGICSTDVIVVAPKASQWSSFVLASISSDEFVAYTDQTSTGTKMPRTSWKAMSEYRVCLPSAHAVQTFQDAVTPMIDGIVANVHESHTLVALRDTLLPKLVSGEIRVGQR